MKIRYQKWLILILRFGFGVLLIIASLGKIGKPLEFAQAVEHYRVVGEGLSLWVGVWLPYLEFLTGLFLIIGVWLDAAVLINTFLMGAFLILVIQAYVRGLDVYCGCFTVEGGAKVNLLKILENIVFVFTSLVLFWFTFRKSKVIENIDE